jgi:hypothetical protein
VESSFKKPATGDLFFTLTTVGLRERTITRLVMSLLGFLASGASALAPFASRIMQMSSSREWTVEEVGVLVSNIDLLTTPAELSSALGRDEQEIMNKIAELGLTHKLNKETGKNENK